MIYFTESPPKITTVILFPYHVLYRGKRFRFSYRPPVLWSKALALLKTNFQAYKWITVSSSQESQEQHTLFPNQSVPPCGPLTLKAASDTLFCKLKRSTRRVTVKGCISPRVWALNSFNGFVSLPVKNCRTYRKSELPCLKWPIRTGRRVHGITGEQ